MILKADKISKKFSSPTIVELFTGISLEIALGESIAIMGKSGVGKSTLLHILGTLETPTEGHLEIAGNLVEKQQLSFIRNKHIGFVFQASHLFEEFSLLDNVLMPAHIARKNCAKGSGVYERALQLLDELELSHRSGFPVKLLSGGEKQRAAIARALINDPDILLADEPSGNLDQKSASHLSKLLIEASQKKKKALIIVTHDPELALHCDACYLLKEGGLTKQ